MRKAIRACLSLYALAAAALPAASAGAAVLVGVEQVELSWSPAGGSPPHYGVWVARNGTDFLPYGLVDEARVSLSVAPGERVAIVVRGVRPHPQGGFELGPASLPSEVINILASPLFPRDGSWVLSCARCARVEYRALSDAMDVTEQVGLPTPWRALGRSLLDVGSDLLTWYRGDTSKLLFFDTDDLLASPIGPISAPRPVDAEFFDYDGDEIDELLFRDPRTPGRLEVWMLQDQALEHVVDVPVPGGAALGPLADYDGDGREDLMLVDYSRRQADVWSLDDFDEASGRWTIQESYTLEALVVNGYQPIAAADFDGSGTVDLLWRGWVHGDLWIYYLDGARIARSAQLPPLAGDDRRKVVGTVDVDGLPGAEIALQDSSTGQISIAYPSEASFPLRRAVLDPGSDWVVVDVAN